MSKIPSTNLPQSPPTPYLDPKYPYISASCWHTPTYCNETWPSSPSLALNHGKYLTVSVFGMAYDAIMTNLAEIKGGKSHWICAGTHLSKILIWTAESECAASFSHKGSFLTHFVWLRGYLYLQYVCTLIIPKLFPSFPEKMYCSTYHVQKVLIALMKRKPVCTSLLIHWLTESMEKPNIRWLGSKDGLKGWLCV